MKKLSLVVLTILILTILKINITQGNIIKYYGYNKPTGIATSLVLEIEGPTIPYGEAIIKLKANGVTSRYRLVLITIDVNKSVPDAHLEEFDGTSLGKSYTVKLETDSMVRFIVCGGEGDVVLNADDVTGDDNPLDSTSLLVKFYPPDIEVPFASIALTGTQPIELKIVITVTDNYAVDLERTEYLIIKNGIEITNFLECNMEGDGYKIGTISCSRSLGGLDSGEYTVLATPADQGGNFGTIVSTSFVILEPSTTTTTIAICWQSPERYQL